ncbi:Uu.00g084880.m01.CDS01 [Anthostomella pinea]|uniref:Uu.00g084880.m01.CDS01 n=1 Tax=Anthostomella pinea TaxID=933095 RepID=A0AAI8VMH8_9PEZI|nr:Uu.00g084880.m01.CDS01 [Anthostomella pinea]
MPVKSYHRSRPSVDRVLDLLADLDENQVEALLLEAESTIASNIPVAKGIDFFERPTSTQPPRRKFLTSLSLRKQSSLRRRPSKRAASAQEPMTTSAALMRNSSEPTQNMKKTPRSYKRISRPLLSLPSPTATADLSEMLAAYLLDATKTLPSSPATAHGPTLSPVSPTETDAPGIDLLEPSPARATRPLDTFGNPTKAPSRNISGIFEVLDDEVPRGLR